MSDVLTGMEAQAPKRPTFLTVLCILTFIGSGWGLISNVMGFMGAKKNAEMMGIVKSEMKDLPSSSEPGAKMAEKMLDAMGTSVFNESNLKTLALIGLGAAVLCLLGAFFMWGLKKMGFYSYVAGTLLGLIGPIALLGAGNLFAMISVGLGGIVGLAFCIMYGLNLKHMK